MDDALNQNQEPVKPPEAAPVAELVPSGDAPSAPTVDTAPDPGTLKTEIEKLQELREKARKDAEYWRREKAQARADYFKSRNVPPPIPPMSPTPAPAEPKAPRPEDFDDYNKFQQAHTKYVEDLADHRANQRIKTWEQEQAQKRAETEYQQRMTVLQERINKGFEKYPDFEDVAMADTVPINQVMIDALAECEAPEDVTYYLGRNRAEAIQISRMTPVAAARAIARIEMNIRQNSPGVLPAPTNQIRNVSNAPPPIKPLGPANTVTKDLEKMSQKEFEEEMFRRTGRRF